MREGALGRGEEHEPKAKGQKGGGDMDLNREGLRCQEIPPWAVQSDGLRQADEGGCDPKQGHQAQAQDKGRDAALASVNDHVRSSLNKLSPPP